MRFLIDQQLPRRLTEFIRTSGHEADHVRDLGLAEAGDPEIWRLGLRWSAVVVSKDEDFRALARSGSGGRRVWVRTGNCSKAELLQRVETSWPDVLGRLIAGEIVVEVR